MHNILMCFSGRGFTTYIETVCCLLRPEFKLFMILPGIDHIHTFYIVQTKAEKDEYLEMIKNGHLNIIVGTHSLLGSRVVYSNLGLLVVDEEQVVL